MEKVKESLPKLLVTGVAVSLSFYLLYKLFGRSGAPSRSSSDPLVEIIDPRVSIAVKHQEAHDAVVAYLRTKVYDQGSGRLPRDQFAELQRLMNFFARALLHDKRIDAQAHRKGLLKRDLGLYLDTVMAQFKNEFEAYNEALELVCESSRVSQKVFNDTYANEPLDSRAILGELRNTIAVTPFMTLRGFSREKAIEMFRNVASLTLEYLPKPEVVERVLTHDDLVVVFDTIAVDLAFEHYDVTGEEFKATLAKYDLFSEPSLQGLIDKIVDTIAQLSPNF